MAAAYTKEIKFENTSLTVILGGVQIKRQWKNKIESYAEPDQQGNNANRQALNLNEVENGFEITAVIDDDLADAFYGSAETKETIYQDFFTIAESTELITFYHGTDTYQGFIQQVDVTESAGDDGAQYEFKIRFLESGDMLA